MIYYREKGILIRDMQQRDVQIIVDEEIAQGWNATADKYETRLKDQMEAQVCIPDCRI